MKHIFLLERAMLVIQDSQVLLVIPALWVILVHQVQHFRANEEKRVFQAQSVRIS
jgi:hypothetical protein